MIEWKKTDLCWEMHVNGVRIANLYIDRFSTTIRSAPWVVKRTYYQEDTIKLGIYNPEKNVHYLDIAQKLVEDQWADWLKRVGLIAI